MAISKTLLAVFLISFLVLQFAHSDDIIMNSNGSGRSLLKKIDCGARCKERCAKSGRPKLCHRACGTCCARCNCVPPGTYDNYDLCPCYRDMTTHGGRPKCP